MARGFECRPGVERSVRTPPEEMNTYRIARAKRKAHNVGQTVPVVVGGSRWSAVSRRVVSRPGTKLQRSQAAMDGDAILPIVRRQEVGNAVPAQIGHLLQPLAKVALDQSLATKRAVAEVHQQGERAKFVYVIAGRDDLGGIVAVQVGEKHYFIGRRDISHRSVEQRSRTSIGRCSSRCEPARENERVQQSHTAVWYGTGANEPGAPRSCEVSKSLEKLEIASAPR